MESVGAALQRARLEQGLDLATIAAHTKINANYLKAIEADDRKSLPSGFFYKSFVHQYALALGLETPEIDAAVQSVLSAEAPPPLPGQESAVAKDVPRVSLVSRLGARSFGQPGTYASAVALLAVVVGCSGIYAWWGHTRAAAEEPQTAAPAAVPASVQASVPAAVPATFATARQAGIPQPTPASKVLVNLVAREETWLSVSTDGKPVFAGLLAPNQTKTVEGNEVAKVVIGNAAGLEVWLNGKLLQPLGVHGQVLTVVFTPGDFRIAPPPAKEGAD